MNKAQWIAAAQTRLRRFAAETERWTAGLLYGGLAASAVLPLVEATAGAVATGNIGLALQVGSLAGSLVGGNLLAEQISRWHERSEADIAAELAASAENDPAWRDALDALLLQLETPQIVQAVLPERDWDRFQRLLQEELAKLGNGDKYADTVLFDQRGQTVQQQQYFSGPVQTGDRHYYEALPNPALAAAEMARRRYLHEMYRRCNVLPLSPLGGDEAAGDEVTLEEVYIALDTQSRMNLTDDEKRALGGGGTLILRAYWRRGLESDRAGAFADELADRLAAGEALVVLDGLDEAPVEQRPAVVRAIAALQRRYPQLARLIVTCRVRSYTDAVRLAGFDEERLAPFDQEKIQRFAHAWYNAQARLGRFDRSTAESRGDDLAQAALSDDLRELSPNPMLLTTMAIVHQKETRPPRERVKLYDKSVEVLAARWQSHRGLAVVPPLAALFADENRLRRVLERLAYEAHLTKQKDVDLPRSQLLTILEEAEFLGDAGLASAFLDYVDQRAGLLVGQGGDGSRRHPQSYAFPHRTFQEYLAGCYLIGVDNGRGAPRAYWEKVGEGDYWYLAGMYGAEELLHNRRGEGRLLDLAYYLCPSAAPAEERGWRAVVWSGQMAALLGAEAIRRDTAGPDGGGAYLARITERLVALLGATHLTPIERAEGGRALGLLGDPRPGVGVIQTAQGVAIPDIDWIDIPAGPFEMGGKESWERGRQFTCHLITQPYRIARYPVTAAQYDSFVRAGGYAEQRWWTEAGWAWRQSQDVTGPARYGEKFQIPNHPVVGVSWYEAIAYCAWLSAQVGYEITLPSEAQWERAARHTDGRVYPWDGDFSPERCNSIETGIGATSAVGIFPGGNAECGAADMSGNVLEWCRSRWLDSYENYAARVRDDLTSDGRRVLRGGSFLFDRVSVRCAFRLRDVPDLRNRLGGFRLLSPGG